MHPRQLYTLPNGDILVVESNSPGTEPVTTPKQLIAGIVKNRSGKGGKGGNRITLLRKKAGSPGDWEQHIRSEEHTSELQSLMRISYADFSLKKNNQQIPQCNIHTHKHRRV